MSVNAYDVGDLVRATVVFRDVAAALVDPSALTAKIRKPDGTFLNYTYLTHAQLVKDSTGTYHVDIDCATAGKYRYRFAGTGSGQAAGEAMFVVQPSALD